MRVIENRAAVVRAIRRGLESFSAPEHMSLREHAERYFYLSSDSSYVEQRWQSWPFQRAILACIGSDDIHEVNVMKSARVGYTKILLAALAYFAEHKRRNQVLFQPTDSARDEFVKTEVDTMIRDVTVLHPIFPYRNKRHKNNTLLFKRFIGSVLHLRGGKAADNYRRLSVSVAALDEYSSFDGNIDGEGDPGKLAEKRLEGATFPKLIIGSTPKRKGVCLMEKRIESLNSIYTYHIPCVHCDELHDLQWGGKDDVSGFKWTDNNPETVKHVCPHCGVLSDQGDYLSVEDKGIWRADDGSTIDSEGVFRNSDGQIIPAPLKVGFHVWTAYSPLVSWSKLVSEFLDAYKKSLEGDMAPLSTFWNTTLGRTWEGEVDKNDSEELEQRAHIEGYHSPGMTDGAVVPKDCMMLFAGADMQGNRIEVGVWGFGRGGEMWPIDHKILFGNPVEEQVWSDLEEFLFQTRYLHEGGSQMPIYGTAIDTGGHHAHAVYDFARKHRYRKVYAIRGRPTGEKNIKDGVTQVDINWRGKRVRKGVKLWYVGTNMAKDLLYGRLGVESPGPGYVHLAADFSTEWFRQFTAEARLIRKTGYGERSVWVPQRKRNEALDCCVYAMWLEVYFDLNRKTDQWWDRMAEKLGIQGVEHNAVVPKAAEKAVASVSGPRVRRPRPAPAQSSYLRSRR